MFDQRSVASRSSAGTGATSEHGYRSQADAAMDRYASVPRTGLSQQSQQQSQQRAPSANGATDRALLGAAGDCGAVALELDHVLGMAPLAGNLTFAGTGPAEFAADGGESSGGGAPVEAPVVATGCGQLLVLSNLDDPHSQRVIRTFAGSITAVDYAVLPAATGSGGGTIGGASNPSTAAMARVGGTVAVVASAHMAAVDGCCPLCLWDADSGALIRRIDTPHKTPSTIESVKFSPDGALVGTTTSDGALCIFECAGGSKVAFFSDPIAGDQARALLWISAENAGTRDQRYVLAVPFGTGPRLFDLAFSVRTLTYELHCRPCQLPGGGGRMGGFQRRYACVAATEQDLLCGCSSGEVIVFNRTSGAYRGALTVCAGGVTGLVAASDGSSTVFACGGDGTVRKLAGHDTNWQALAEVSLGSRCVAIALNGPAYGGDGDQLIVTTADGTMARLLAADFTYAVAAQAVCGVPTAIAVPRSAPDATAPGTSYCASCSTDGVVRLWSLADFSVAGAFALPIDASASHGGLGAAPAAFGGSQAGGRLPVNGGGAASQHTGSHGGRVAAVSAGALAPTSSGVGVPAAGVVVPTACVFDPLAPWAVLVGWSDGRVRCVDFSACQHGGPPRLAWTLPNGHKGAVTAIDCCLEYMVTGGQDAVVRVWSHPGPDDSRAERALVTEVEGHRAAITAVRIDNVSSTLLHTASLDMSHRVHDLSTVLAGAARPFVGQHHTRATTFVPRGNAGPAPRCVRTHADAHCSGFVALCQRPDREHEAVVGTADGKILFYDMDTPNGPVGTIADAARVPVCALDATPAVAGLQGPFAGAALLAAGRADGTLTICAMGAAAKDQDVRAAVHAACHAGAVVRVLWTADGRQVISCGAEGELFVWNIFQR